jgi:DNA-binding NtrC family response regulator
MKGELATLVPWKGKSGPSEQIMGTSPAIRRILELIRKVAPTEESVLIQGESGTGKELVARALHRASLRAGKLFVAFNCTVLQETLLESELFGHEKGAFTSADRAKQGLFELASGGTLFIDEIGEMAPGAQAKLLRVLEDGRIRRVGAVTWIQTDVRVIAATNRDLAREVTAGRFRSDLFYRLNVFGIRTVPLRERREDIPLLAQHFLSQGTIGPRDIDPTAMRALLAHDWPGNVRELQNAIKRARILAEGPVITVADLPDEVTQRPRDRSASTEYPAMRATETRLDEVEKQHLRWALDSEGWNQSRAALKLGISRHRLARLLSKHGLKRIAT